MFAHLAQMLAPIIITTLNPALAPLAGAIGNGIAAAEQIPGATSASKLQSVLDITAQAATGVNNAAGKVVVDPAGLQVAATEAINTTVAILNLVHPVAVASQAAVPAVVPVVK